MSLFGTLVKQRRKHLGYSQYEAAMRSGVPPHRISKIEKGGNCQLDTARKISKALGIEAIPVG